MAAPRNRHNQPMCASGRCQHGPGAVIIRRLCALPLLDPKQPTTDLPRGRPEALSCRPESLSARPSPARPDHQPVRRGRGTWACRPDQPGLPLARPPSASCRPPSRTGTPPTGLRSRVLRLQPPDSPICACDVTSFSHGCLLRRQVPEPTGHLRQPVGIPAARPAQLVAAATAASLSALHRTTPAIAGRLPRRACRQSHDRADLALCAPARRTIACRSASVNPSKAVLEPGLGPASQLWEDQQLLPRALGHGGDSWCHKGCRTPLARLGRARRQVRDPLQNPSRDELAVASPSQYFRRPDDGRSSPPLARTRTRSVIRGVDM